MKKELKPTNTSGKLVIAAKDVQLIKALKGSGFYFQMTSGDGSKTFKSKPLTDTGLLQLLCNKESMQFEIKDSTVELVNVKMGSEDPK